MMFSSKPPSSQFPLSTVVDESRLFNEETKATVLTF